MGKIVKTSSGWMIKDLLIRWNERQEQHQTDEGTEHVYDAHRIDYLLPIEVQPGMEAVEYYLSLESTKTVIVQLAQDLVAQEVGFHVE